MTHLGGNESLERSPASLEDDVCTLCQQADQSSCKPGIQLEATQTLQLASLFVDRLQNRKVLVQYDAQTQDPLPIPATAYRGTMWALKGLPAKPSTAGVSASSSAPHLQPIHCRQWLNSDAALQPVRGSSVQAQVATADHARLSQPPQRSKRCAHTASATAAQQAPAQASSSGQAAADDSLPALRSRLQLYNTLAKSKQPFTTRTETPNSVQMYVCGVTVYDYSHIGEVAAD